MGEGLLQSQISADSTGQCSQAGPKYQKGHRYHPARRGLGGHPEHMAVKREYVKLTKRDREREREYVAREGVPGTAERGQSRGSREAHGQTSILHKVPAEAPPVHFLSSNAPRSPHPHTSLHSRTTSVTEES